MPGILLRTFHDRCRRSARSRLRGSFFCLFQMQPLRAPAAMVPAHLTMGFALCNGKIPPLLRCLLRSHTKYAPLFAPCKTRISLIALCKNE